LGGKRKRTTGGGKIEGKGRERGRERERGGGKLAFLENCPFSPPPLSPSLSLSLSLSHFTAPFLIFLPSSFQHVVFVVVVVLDLVAAAVLVVGVDPASPGAPD
jgi:hypothetical protein